MAWEGNSPRALQRGGLQERREILLETTREALASDDPSTLSLILNSQHAADLAELLRHLDERERRHVLQVVAEPLAAQALADSDSATLRSVTAGLEDEVLSELLVEMAPDDAADLLAELPEPQSESVLQRMGAEADEVRELLSHAGDSGGGIMTSRLVAVLETINVAEAVDYLRSWAGEEEILTIFAVDARRRLVGTVPLRRMLLAAADMPISELIERDAISVGVEMDQEEIAQIFAAYDLLALPVVDDDGELVGQVTVDDIVDVITAEATEDMYELAATSSHELEERSALGVMRRRMPWLLVCLAGTLLSGGILDLFSGTLAAFGGLVFFVPAIMAMGGNTGIQSSTVMVRSLATGLIQPEHTAQRLRREVKIGLGMGSCLGMVVYAVGTVWVPGSTVAICAGLAMFAAIVMSACLGAMVPLLFRALGIDPAVASGPLITTLNDVLSLSVYFGIAAALAERVA